MTTNPQSEKCCEKCKGQRVIADTDGNTIPACHFCPCHKESPVSQTVEWNSNTFPNREDITRNLGAVSQTDGWEKEFDENISIGMPAGVQAEIKDFIRKVEKESYWAGIKVMDEEADRAISTTLFTLVKEMEKEKHTEMDCICDTTCLWNQGISAAVETINAHLKKDTKTDNI